MIEITNKMNSGEKEIYEKYRESFPFPIVEFANKIGLKVFIDDELPDTLSGAISKEGDIYHIILNGKHSENRMRFTLAHELGHYFNDKDFLDKEGKIEDESRQSKNWLYRKWGSQPCDDVDMNKRDVMANQFAAEILMPQDVFIKKWKELSTPEEVAKYFKVSPDAVRVRASYLLGEIV